jgi:hypothetical protein
MFKYFLQKFLYNSSHSHRQTAFCYANDDDSINENSKYKNLENFIIQNGAKINSININEINKYNRNIISTHYIKVYLNINLKEKC